MKIDLVVPYVNCNDPTWQDVYKKTREEYGLNIREKDMNGIRYRELGFFKYFFRGLYYFCPWINNIYIILASTSQIPEWLNIDNPKIHIVFHKDIIPKVFLPTFNSTCIEMFIKNIKGLSEYFLYANDDMYIIDDLTPDMFFTDDGIPKYKMIKSNKIGNQYRKVCFNEFEMVRNLFKRRSLGKNTYLKPQHIFQPMCLSTVKEAYYAFELHILNSITAFRKETNINQYIYTLYQAFKGQRISDYPSYRYYELNDKGIEDAGNDIRIKKYKIICLNDSANTNKEKAINELVDSFEFIFMNKCEYEK